MQKGLREKGQGGNKAIVGPVELPRQAPLQHVRGIQSGQRMNLQCLSCWGDCASMGEEARRMERRERLSEQQRIPREQILIRTHLVLMRRNAASA
jgi:hypothetical protein